MKGFFHKALIIDLANKKYHVEPIPDEVFENYLGGKGLGVYLLLKRCRPGTDPFSPENPFVIALGPISDTNIWGSSRYGVFTKSPLTGIFAESYSGGRVTEPISRTGHDAIILEGASPGPVFLEIGEEAVLFHDATDLWGSDSYEAQDLITEKVDRKDTGVLVIGPAAENLVRFASVVNDYWRCAGRTGVGAVLGSKKVKGLAFHGTKRREAAQKESVDGFRKEWTKKGKFHPYAQGYKMFGTPGLVSAINKFEAFPTRYWAEGVMEGWEDISAETLHAKFSVKRRACSRCFLACGRLTTITEGRHKGLTIDGPEYETIYAIGGLCLIKDLGEIIYLNDICDRLGIDTITAGNLAAFAIEASQRGKIAERLDYGDAECIASLFYKIARKEGIGAVLAEGIRHAARQWGLDDRAIHVKGMEPGGYDPRFFKGMGLAYATSDRGGCHIRSTFFRAEASGMIPPDQIEGKAEMFLDYEDRLIIHDALILCRFYRDLYQWNELLQMVKITTGMDLSKDQLRKVAANIQTATRVFNMREGITRADDTLPRRFFEEPIGSKSSVIMREDLERLKDDYYMLRGWDKEGIPLEKLPCL
ncbi:MAG: aldehyde ferredoxin oxidoreductase family protein [Syntrophorhabdaceae bacterium]|nr:aldehyde ferredoxin oxidoreductase family protein [Syntrophorhabdaceae bacterium]